MSPDEPKTPRRKEKAKTVYVSPYFSPVLKSGEAHWHPEPRKSPPKECLPEPLTCEERMGLGEPPGEDPLALFYHRKFERLFNDLEGLKPKLIQETVADDPWKLLVAVTLLNKTTGRAAIPVFWKIMERWSTPFLLSQATEQDLVIMLTPLGTQRIRAQRLKEMSRLYLLDRPSVYDPRTSRATLPSVPGSPKKRRKYPDTPISHLPGAGAYALDSYRIFCSLHDDPASTEWRQVLPTDKELIRYLVGPPVRNPYPKSELDGPGSPITVAYLRALIQELSPPPTPPPSPRKRPKKSDSS
ncbi:hypothetical protein CC1G_11852 [Coprinopsis cinerea okayama7|uniref:HhH-GPD domain-containing protein n=1 Tax=Coprinopsis cinerea (strain Okayama-7 / 130 / ATCC MYA-4618 / FGSC 9003) TaxID=240176 RepID=A8PH21_COPC7|nr:hypothetical protein CC1G_11852 [Coprinopsis cinerea okayama7\|eukprot:XP_001841324.2 hypothetical protein CC1G_11852 [Coprinopsis cinerea okayama7\